LKKTALLIFVLMLSTFLAACSGGNQFDQKVEQEKATKVVNGVLTSFEDEEKLAEAKTRDEANQIAWKKINEKNSKAISKDLNETDQRRLLYLLTTNKAEDLPDGATKANLLFSQDTKNINVSFNESTKTFTFNIERSGFEHKLITFEKQEDTWKIVKVEDPE
jgi:PBP1b-binding outer membrane lipoprotein LpoB